MQVFHADNRLYLSNEVKHGFITLGIWCIVFLLLRIFAVFTWQTISFVAIILLFFGLRDVLIPYRVNKITVDPNAGKLRIDLRSFLLGKQDKVYDLKEVRSELLNRSGILKRLFPSVVIKIALPTNQEFQISGRYGFTKETLESVDNSIKLNRSDG